jgi:hypothetical protein
VIPTVASAKRKVCSALSFVAAGCRVLVIVAIWHDQSAAADLQVETLLWLAGVGHVEEAEGVV